MHQEPWSSAEKLVQKIGAIKAGRRSNGQQLQARNISGCGEVFCQAQRTLKQEQVNAHC
jgi:hypothetical protein